MRKMILKTYWPFGVTSGQQRGAGEPGKIPAPQETIVTNSGSPLNPIGGLAQRRGPGESDAMEKDPAL